MKHKDTMKYWEDMAHNKPNRTTVKVNPQNDYTAFDADFIMKHANDSSEILDLASGTGLAIDKYYNAVGHIDAVELFPEFSKFITESPNISVFNDDVTKFSPIKKYDLILMFGMVQYFSESEIKSIYKRYKKYLKPSGKLIIKNQFGVKKDVVVSGLSKELNKPYYSEYRHIDKEVATLSSIGFTTVKVHDIYPPEGNRWDNTHFYAIVAE